MKNIFTFLVILSCASCASDASKTAQLFDLGKAENGIYTNTFFNLEVPFDTSWKVQDKQQMSDIIKASENIILGDDKLAKKLLDASLVNSAYLFTIFKHEVGAAVDFNPSLMVMAENTKIYPGIQTGSDYLFHTKKLLAQTQMDYDFDKPLFKQKIGSVDFDTQEAILHYMNHSITQEYASYVTKGFCLTFILSYANEAEKNELHLMLDQVKLTE
jgi:hypothetical protein